MPPNVQSVEHSLELNIFRAEGLPKMDTCIFHIPLPNLIFFPVGKCDGYVAASFGGSQGTKKQILSSNFPEIKTEIIQKEYNPVWLECLTIPTVMPTMVTHISYFSLIFSV